MSATADNPIDALVDRLRSHLSRPLSLDGDAARFVSATFGTIDADTLEDLFCDGGASEAETLLEFLLFPDVDFQYHIEPLLNQICFDGDLTQHLAACLAQSPIPLTIHLGGDGGDLSLPLPDDFLQRFLIRLRVSRRWPSSLESALTRCLAADEQIRARVMLRNAAARLGTAAADVCTKFIEALPSSHRDFWSALDLVVGLAAELEASRDPFALLTAHKQRAFQMVEQQRSFERLLQRSNMETLMGQGHRTPTLARADARKRMRVIDVICRAVFGRTTYFQPAEFG